MKKIYIASPYRKGDVGLNVKRQIDVGNILMNNNFSPFLPLLSHFQHMIHPRTCVDWLNNDFEWLSSCDCLLRLKGDSYGADMEVEYANKLGIKVFYEYNNIQDTIDEILEYFKNKEESNIFYE